MVCKLDKQIFPSEFESHQVPHSYGFEPHLNKKLSKSLISESVCKVIEVEKNTVMTE